MPEETNDLDALHARLKAAKSKMADLEASVARYRGLYEMIEEAIVTLELVTDGSGQPLDCLFIDHNPAFQRLMNVAPAVGRRCSEVFAKGSEQWMRILTQLMQLRAGQRFDHYIPERGLWVDVYAAAVTQAAPLHLEIVLSDITERRNADIRNNFLVNLSDSINGLQTPEAIAQATARLLRDTLDIEWVMVGQRSPGTGVPRFVKIGSSREGEAGPELFGNLAPAAAIAALEQGAPMLQDELPYSPGAEETGPTRLRSFALMPCLKDGQLQYLLGAYHTEPTAWEPQRIELIRLAAERSWAAMERARAETALRESEAQLRVTMESATDYAIISSDIRGIIVGWSAGAELIFGYSSDEAIGLSADLIFTPEDVATGAP